MRILSFAGTGIACCGIALALAPPGATNPVPRRAFGLPGPRFAPMLRRPAARRFPSVVATPAPCETSTSTAFVAIHGSSLDFAAGDYSSELGGSDNETCGNYSSIAGGQENRDDAGGTQSFIGAGFMNYVLKDNSFIGSGGQNYIGAFGGFVGGGFANLVNGDGSVIVGGGTQFYGMNNGAYGNQISGSAIDAFIGAGDQNVINANQGFIGSGYNNTIGNGATYASIIGGGKNAAMSTYATVIGGFSNSASGAYSIVAGGNSDTAAGVLSFAAGYHADAANNGSFVWSDYKSGSTTAKDTAANQFVVRASGGTTIYSNETMTSGVKLAPGGGSWANFSDRNAKTGVVPLDDASILAKVERLPVSAWSYKSETGVRHVGPMAQDFYNAFGVGEDDRHITSIDEDGVALSAIKALDRKNVRLQATVDALRAGARRKDADFAALTAQVRRLETAMATLQKR